MSQQTRRKATAKDWAITLVFLVLIVVGIKAVFLGGSPEPSSEDPMVAKFQTVWSTMSEEDQTTTCNGWHLAPVLFAEEVAAQSGADIGTVRRSLASVCGAA